MRISELTKVATEMEVSLEYAISCRKRYLTVHLWEIDRQMEEIVADTFKCQFEDKCDCRCRPPCRMGLSVALFARLKAKREAVHRELRAIEKTLAVGHLLTPGRITDEMIARAREYPVDRLVEFHRGRALAWCHNDRTPSLYHGTRKNVAVCPVCNRTFNPIDILVERDGLAFIEAVKGLQ